MALSPPPIYATVVEQDGKATLPWILFMNQLYEGDNGSPATGTNSWTPTFTSLTQVGVPSITGKYYRSGQFIDFWVKIVPGTSTSATAGTTYIGSLPFTITSDTHCSAVTGTTGVGLGVIQASTGRIYVPSWSLVTSLLTITGRVEAS